ncbi:putative ribonuclease H-like domain-containing protein, partial [Tanacetum coccineum]
ANYNYHQRERVVSGNNKRVNYNYSAKKAHPSAHRNIVPRAVLMKTSLRPLNTARPNLAVVNVVRIQASDGLDFKEFDGGYVTFGGGAKGEKITGKGTLKTGKLDFEDMYFVKELQFNLLSVSQMCDKKNNVLFTNTACFVLSLDFKLTDESQVLLKVPRKNYMYSVDMKNIVPKESLTCLVAKAILDESMLWHRRLDHVNFKTINKLVKENLVRGLPTKRFKNDQTCVACLKGKQHKASYKSKIQNFITQPLFMLHMDLFGPTFVSSLMNKKYCLVVTDDYSRFTWVFFLASKDETCGILNSFITKIENLVDKKALRGNLKSMNYVPVVAGTNYNDLVGTEESIGVGHSSKETGSSQDYVLMPLWKDGSLFDSSLKNASNDEPQPSSDAGKKDDDGVCKESGIADQEKSENSTQGVNTVGLSINTESDMFSLGDNATATHVDFFGDETKVDMNNITTTYPIPSTPNIRIHKDHSLDHVIGDV